MSQRRRNPMPPQQPKVRPIRPDGGKVCIAFIHPGQVSSYFMSSMLAATLYDRGRGLINNILQEWSSANVSNARNSLTRRFVEEKTESEWLLWIDADMQFDHDAIERLVASADPVERPIVGGLCFGMNAETGLFPTIYHVVDTFGTLKTVRATEYPPDAMFACSATGAAFILIHRTVLEAMAVKKFNAAFPWFQETEIAGMPCGEDITFCLRAQLLHFPTYVNTGVRIGHHKSQVLDEALYLAQREVNADGAADTA